MREKGERRGGVKERVKACGYESTYRGCDWCCFQTGIHGGICRCAKLCDNP